MAIRMKILEEMRIVAIEQNKLIAPLLDDLPLLNSGLDSLCFAIIVARLEEALNIDPFDTNGDMDLPITVGDLVKFYESALRVAS